MCAFGYNTETLRNERISFLSFGITKIEYSPNIHVFHILGV